MPLLNGKKGTVVLPSKTCRKTKTKTSISAKIDSKSATKRATKLKFQCEVGVLDGHGEVVAPGAGGVFAAAHRLPRIPPEQQLPLRELRQLDARHAVPAAHCRVGRTCYYVHHLAKKLSTCVDQNVKGGWPFGALLICIEQEADSVFDSTIVAQWCSAG